MKKELRKKYKKIRDQIQNRDEKSHQIAQKLYNSPYYQKAHSIALYYSFGSEINTIEMIQKAIGDGKRVFLPRVKDEYHMDFYEIHSLEECHPGAFNILEPDEGLIKIKPDEIEVMILPGLCFDMEKNRLGYGKGYYDYYLENTNIFKIGICFHEQLLTEERIHTDKNDIQMDMIITD